MPVAGSDRVSERFSRSSTKYGLSVSSGVTTQAGTTVVAASVAGVALLKGVADYIASGVSLEGADVPETVGVSLPVDSDQAISYAYTA